MTYFNAAQLSIIGEAFKYAEDIAAKHYRMSRADMTNLHYDVKTLAQLEAHEVSDSAFAHLCRYRYHTPQQKGKRGDFFFYRICLQDNRIIDAMQRNDLFITLPPLMLYIAVHELIHVIRFVAGEMRFDVSSQEKETEENKVHWITRQMLSAIHYPGLNVVLDCFSDRPIIGGLVNYRERRRSKMPIYEYKCKKCGDEFEIFKKITECDEKKCKHCNGPVQKLISLSSFQLQGSGWYVTDYGKKKTESEDKKTETSSSVSSTDALSAPEGDKT